MGKRILCCNRLKTVFVIAAALFIPAGASAMFAPGEIYWNGGNGDWNDSANWDLERTPSEGDSVYIKNSGIISYDVSDSSVSRLEIDSNDSTGNVFNHSEGRLTITHLNEQLEEDGYLLVNNSNGGKSEYNLSGDAVLIKKADEVKIGTDGVGVFNQSGGTFQFNGALYLGDQSTGHGIFNMTGGELTGCSDGVDTFYGGIALGEWGGKGTFNHSGGSVTISDLTLARQEHATGEYYLGGNGVLNVNSFIKIAGNTDAKGTFIQSGGTLNTPEIQNNDTFMFKDGNLNVDSFINNGLLRGAGTINPYSPDGAIVTLENNGTVAPGNSPGTLIINGDYTQTEWGVLEIELGKSSYDILEVFGRVSLDGILKVSFYDGYVPEAGTTASFDFLKASEISGVFDTITAPDGWLCSLDYLDKDGDGLKDAIQLKMNPVPVPAALWLLASGFLGLIGMKSRKKTG